MLNDRCFPCIEPPRFHLTSISWRKQLSGNKNNVTALQQRRSVAEEWTWEESDAEDGRLVLKHIQEEKYLCIDEVGEKIMLSSSLRDGLHAIYLEPASGAEDDLHFVVLRCDLSTNVKIMDCESSDDLYLTNYHEGIDAQWEMELLSGELCFMATINPTKKTHVQCNPSGSLSLKDDWYGWSVWRFMEVRGGEFVIASWTHHTYMLCSDKDGKVFTVETSPGPWDDERGKWIIRKSSPDGLTIQSKYSKRILSVSKDGNSLHTVPIIYENDSSAHWCRWDLQPAHRNTFFLTFGKKHLGCSADNTLCVTEKRSDTEKWKIEYATEGDAPSVTVQQGSINGLFLASRDENIGMEEGITSPQTVWDIEKLSAREVCLSNTDGFYLHVENEQHVLCSSNIKEATWLLEPCMPRTRTYWQQTALNVATTAAIGMAALSPLAVVGTIGAIGFGATGISAGSMAAGMMSAEAIASGGAIAAGGTVATLQSIGAAGLGLAGTTAAMAGGTVAGGLAVGTTHAVVSRQAEEHANLHLNVANRQANSNKALAGWKFWRIESST